MSAEERQARADAARAEREKSDAASAEQRESAAEACHVAVSDFLKDIESKPVSRILTNLGVAKDNPQVDQVLSKWGEIAERAVENFRLRALQIERTLQVQAEQAAVNEST